MKFSQRATAVAALFVLPLALLSGCGGDSAASTGDAGGRLSPIQPTSYVTFLPETTSTTTPAAATTDPPKAGDRSKEPQTYKVKSGDTISAIAKKFDVTMDALIAYNDWSGPNQLIVPGQTVKIPPDGVVPGDGGSSDGGTAGGTDGDTSDDDTATQTTAASGDDCPTTYTIKEGDTSRIKVAAKFDLTYEEMDAANVNTPGYSSFLVGTEIVIPCPSD